MVKTSEDLALGTESSKKDNEEDANFLKYNKNLWAEIELRWKRACSYRKKEIAKSTEKNIASILIDWPLLKNSHGYDLVITILKL